MQNATGAPAVSLPLATTAAGLPQGMMLAAGRGREAMLLELGYEMEEARPWPLLRDVEHFSRRRPWMIAGIGLVAGLAASRFLKASSERRYDGSKQESGSSAGHSMSTSSFDDRHADEPLVRESNSTSG